jgi:histidinol-phosphate aminotransferase
LHGVTPDQVVVGCGSSEILRMAVDAFVGPARQLVVARPTFGWISECARRSSAEVVAIPLSADYSHDLDAMLARTHAATGLVYICNPNNPTGTLTRRRDVDGFLGKLQASAYVLIDEAHHHYAGESADYASFIDRPVNDARVIVSRSFSTVYGLAGLRVGYAICAPDTARLLRSTQVPDSVNVAAAEAALAALEDAAYVRTCVQHNTDERQEFLNQANARMVGLIDSQTNFVMVNAGIPAAEVVTHFKNNDVLVAGPVSDFDKYIRVSLGTSLEMRRFWSVWDRMPGGHMMGSQPAMLHD